MRVEEKYRFLKELENDLKNRTCSMCGRKEDDIEDFTEGVIHEDESPESEVIGKYLLCDSCFEDMQCEWVGF